MKYYLLVIALITGTSIGCHSSHPIGSAPANLDQRRAEVAEKGAEVMPFDLEATTHIFEKLTDGGLQQVVADSDEPTQIRLIREHLKDISVRFASGNFHDPTMIHGAAMPGLHELVMGYKQITISFDEIETGAEIRYSTENPKLVSAIHAWFDAQVSDHGDHAQHDH